MTAAADLVGAGAGQRGRAQLDQAARELLAIVEKVASTLVRRLPACVERDDLVQAGMFGAMHAQRVFDASKGRTFANFVWLHAECAMLDELRRADHLTRGARERFRQVERAVGELWHALDRRPRDSEVAERLGVSLAELREIVTETLGARVHSLDAMQEDGNGPLETLIAPDPAHLVDQAQQLAAMHAAVDELPPRHRKAMRLIYRQGHSQEAVAELWGVTPSRVCQVHQEAVQMLQRRLAAPQRPAAGPGEIPEGAPTPPRRSRGGMPIASRTTASTNPALPIEDLFAADIVRGAAPDLLRAPRHQVAARF